MKSFAFVFLTICCFFVAIQSAAVEPVVAELEKDNAQDPVTEKELSANEDCIQPKETGRCFALFYRFAYDVEKRECVEFIYGGCAGNTNNFETKKDCEVKCMDGKQNTPADEDVMQTTVTASVEAETTTEQVVATQS